MKFENIAVYERTFDTIILAQNLEDLFMNGPQGPYAVVTQYRFTGENRSRLREFTAKKAKDTWNYRHRNQKKSTGICRPRGETSIFPRVSFRKEAVATEAGMN